MKALNIDVLFILKGFYNYISDLFFNMLVLVLKPVVHFFYKRYCTYRSYSVRKQVRIKREIMRKSIIVSATCILGVLIAFTASFLSKDVKAENDEHLHKYYTFYTVEPGDSLWNVADEYCELGYEDHFDYIDEVMFINHLDNSDDIVSGETLVLPYYSYEVK